MEGPAGVAVPPPTLGASRLSLGPPRPNPARALAPISVDIHLQNPQAADIALYDLSGREVAAGPVALVQAGKTTLSLKVPSLGPGIFFATLRSSEGVVLASRRIAIVR